MRACWQQRQLSATDVDRPFLRLGAHEWERLSIAPQGVLIGFLVGHVIVGRDGEAATKLGDNEAMALKTAQDRRRWSRLKCLKHGWTKAGSFGVELASLGRLALNYLRLFLLSIGRSSNSPAHRSQPRTETFAGYRQLLGKVT